MLRDTSRCFSPRIVARAEENELKEAGGWAGRGGLGGPRRSRVHSRRELVGWNGTRWAGVVVVAVLACASSRYRVERAQLQCDDANAQVHRALVGRKYEITRFSLATPGGVGVVEARRKTPQGLRHGRVRILCEDPVVFQPVEGAWFLPDFEFSREVYYALLAHRDTAVPSIGGSSGGSSGATPSPAANRPAGRPEYERGLRVVLRPLDRFETRKTTGADLTLRGVLVVRVEIRNLTGRIYVLPPRGITLVDDTGNRIQPLERSGVARILRESTLAAPDPEADPLPPIDVGATVRTLEGQALTYGRMTSGETRAGSLYFPAGQYRSGRVRLLDEETGETEGTVVGF